MVVLSQAVTATMNAADDGMPKATLKLPLRLNATPDVGFKTESTTPAAEQRVGEEIEYGITTTAVGRHPVPAASFVEPESQPQMASEVAEQVVETIWLGPVQVVQAAQGAVPEGDQVEPAEQEPEPPPLAEHVDAAWHDHEPPEHLRVWPAGQLPYAGIDPEHAEQRLMYPPGE